ncbi:MAG: phosphatidylinositol-specific phospholipase C1-like protein [Planctomycetota bacterium]
MNEVQVIGSHNSYKLAIDGPLLDLLKAFSQDAQALDYAHVPLTEQLDMGVRGLELDLYHDPDGGRYAKPLGLEMVRRLGKTPDPFDEGPMLRPGFKVLHVSDIDFRSNQPTLAGCLAELRRWSEAHRGHLPIVVTMNLKTDPAPVPGAVKPLPFDRDALNRLDAELIEGLGRDRLITPDLVRGDAETLNRAVLERGWPTLGDLADRFLFAMDEGGEKRREYLRGHASLRERVMFTTPSPGEDDAAVLVMNDPLKDGPRIAELVQAGYLVRTRADAGTSEARAGDRRRLDAALASGANIVSTDYYLKDTRFGTNYEVRLPNGAVCRERPGLRVPTTQAAEETNP